MAYTTVFSEFEVLEQHIKFEGDEEFSTMSCVGKSEEELDVKSVTKKCRGVEVKRKTRGAGSGSLKESLHVPYDIYNKMYAMNRDNLAEGVYAYGQNSRHGTFALTQKVLDEDGNVKFKAYPKCTLTSGPKRSIENGQEEVPELELEIALMPDANGECMYEAIFSEVSEQIQQGWLTNFTPELVKAPGA